MSHDLISADTAWHRFTGAFANSVPSHGPGNAPTVGTAWHRCVCCGRDYLIVAAVAPDGQEINVALPALEAVEFVEQAVGLVAGMGRGCAKESVQ